MNPAQTSDNIFVPPHNRNTIRRITAALMGLISLSLLSACTTTPVDQTRGFIRVEAQISAVNHKTYEVRVTDLSNQNNIDMILGSGDRGAQWLTPGSDYHVQVDVVTPKGKNTPGLNRKSLCDNTVSTRGHHNVVIIVTDPGCHIEH